MRAPGPGYEDFPAQGALKGTVTKQDGSTLKGKLFYDVDEAEGWETLDGENDGLSYSIPFAMVSSISPAGSSRSKVTLKGSSEELRLEESRTSPIGTPVSSSRRRQEDVRALGRREAHRLRQVTWQAGSARSGLRTWPGACFSGLRMPNRLQGCCERPRSGPCSDLRRLCFRQSGRGRFCFREP